MGDGTAITQCRRLAHADQPLQNVALAEAGRPLLRAVPAV